MGGGGGGGDCYLQGFGGSFRGGLAVGSLDCWTLSERERRRPSRIACEISFENDFTSSSSKSDSLVHVRDCSPSWVKELPGGVADDVIFPIRVVGLRVGPSEMGLLPVQVSNLVMATVMASLLLSFWSRVVSFDPCPFGFDESDDCSFGSSRRKSARSFSASACPGRLLSSNCGGFLGAGS